MTDSQQPHPQQPDHSPGCPSCGETGHAHPSPAVMCRQIQELKAEIDRLGGCANERQGFCRGWKEVSDGK